ncbi:cytochrome P450 3A24-like isoform X2 [Littorina saxatilis]|uniref:Cytochrome P450 n=1 Tax=Littorina saxatilis TaxID=31220 RepID=A0AAN9BEB8_9CAEN
MDVFEFKLDTTWVTPLALLIMTALLLYVYGTWTFSTWSRQGIPGPKPLPYIGNVNALRKDGIFKTITDWSKKYGKFFGLYLMRQPLLLTTDVEILKEVFVKDFTNFPERAVDTALAPYPMGLGLAFVKGEQWRRQRLVMTPTFSASKLKMMGSFISRCCDNLVKAIGKSTEEGKLLDVKRLFGSYTLDVIAGTSFGFETNCFENDDNVFLQCAKEVFGGAQQFGVASVIAAMFPPLGPVLRKMGFSSSPLKETRFLIDTIAAVIDERHRNNSKAHQDLTQLMLDAEATDAEVTKNPDRKQLTRDEIIAQGLLFFVAGYETTATTLQYLSYLLALNPERQEKLHDAVVAAIGDEDVCYSNVMNIPYLDCCIREALRIFPAVAIMNRVAKEERTINGVTIPAGTHVGANIIALMRDEEFFPEPLKFLPERFDDEKQPIPQFVKDMVFGAGPRQCIGMRLALFETKMAAASVIRKFRFVKAEETPTEITFGKTGLSAPDKPIFVATERR